MSANDDGLRMTTSEPPPIPATRPPVKKLRRRLLIGLAATAGAIFVSLRLLGLIRPFSVPTGAMTPAVSAGDHIMMEGLTYLVRKPRRGDIIVFRTDGMSSIPVNTIYLKRVAAGPGERLRISDGMLYVNETNVQLRNAMGEIHYTLFPGSPYLGSSNDAVTVPKGCYFVLGDNSANSADSRFWGFVPAANILGRASVCYWPPKRVGRVK